MRLIFLFLTLPLIIFANSVVYKVYYGFFPAGKIEISFKGNKVLVKGKSEGIISWFYKYRLLMEYDLNNPKNSFLVENENGRKKIYNFKRILKKKPWLPLVVNVLLKKPSFKEKIEVGEYTLILKKKLNGNYIFFINGSKKTKSIEVFDWFPPRFPQKIKINTTKGNIILEKIEENGM
jgi:hypothetical protein